MLIEGFYVDLKVFLSNHLEYLHVKNSNFLDTERILKIRNSAESVVHNIV